MEIEINGTIHEIHKEIDAEGKIHLYMNGEVVSFSVQGIASLISKKDEVLVPDGDVRAALLAAEIIEQTGRVSKSLAYQNLSPIVRILV